MANIFKDQIGLQRVSSHEYTINWHNDWTVGPTLHGGCVAAALHHVAVTHLATTLAAQDQPDILTLHYEFLRFCVPQDSTVKVTELKVGASTSNIRLELSQRGKVNVIALATSMNFDKPAGPSFAMPPRVQPSPTPTPDFERINKSQAEDNWLPWWGQGDMIAMSRHMLGLAPRRGYPVDGVHEAWHRFMNDERVDATCLAFVADFVPSLPDTVLRNGGVYDAWRMHAIMEKEAAENPGVPTEMWATLEHAKRAELYNNTITLDLEFKRRVPREGLRWVYLRAVARTLENGRTDFEATICDEEMTILCVARQVLLVLDSKRRFAPGRGKTKPAL